MNLDSTLRAAREAQVKWETFSVSQRLSYLAPLRSLIVDRIDEILVALQEDVGKTPLDALSGDILVTLEFLAFAQSSAEKALEPRKISHEKILFWGTQFREEYFPFGVVAVLSPWNYPFQLSLIPALSALVAGNAVILKSSPFTPKTTEQIAELFKSLELPNNLFQVQIGDAAQGRALLEASPDFIFFTGSSRSGREVALGAAQRLIPSILELGGKDACIVFADADLDRTVQGALYAAFANCGQICVGAKRLLVERLALESFSKALVERIAQLRIGRQVDSDFGFASRALNTTQIEELVKDAIEKGARLLTPASPFPLKFPVLLADVPETAKITREEIFGPILCLESFSNEKEAIKKVNESEYGLGASIWTGDRSRGERVASALKVGTCSINDAILQLGNPAASFGGVRASGWGRYRGESGFRSFCNRRSVMDRRKLNARERHWFPASEKTFQQLRTLISFKHGKSAILRKIFRSLSCLLCVVTFSLKSFASDPQGNLRIVVSGLKEDDTGEIAYAIFRDKNGFPSNKDLAFRKDFVASVPRLADGSLEIKVEKIPFGTYAIAIYLDQNGDRELNKNFLGIPQEPAGASRNPPGRLGPPMFKECEFEFRSEKESYPIKLVR